MPRKVGRGDGRANRLQVQANLTGQLPTVKIFSAGAGQLLKRICKKRKAVALTICGYLPLIQERRGKSGLVA